MCADLSHDVLKTACARILVAITVSSSSTFYAVDGSISSKRSNTAGEARWGAAGNIDRSEKTLCLIPCVARI